MTDKLKRVSNYSEKELLTMRDVLIDNGQMVVKPEYITSLRAKVAEYEARYQADLVQFLAYDRRVTELESQLAAERDALLSSASDVVGMDVRIKELEAAYAEIVNAPYEAAQGRIAELEAENAELKRRLQRAGVFLADIHMTDEGGAE